MVDASSDWRREPAALGPPYGPRPDGRACCHAGPLAGRLRPRVAHTTAGAGIVHARRVSARARGSGMGRIEHRRPRPGHGDTRVGPRRLPPVGFAFLGLAAVAAVIELWPIVNAIWIGATTWPGEVPRLLPQ